MYQLDNALVTSLGDGPINLILCSPQIFENLAFSRNNNDIIYPA